MIETALWSAPLDNHDADPFQLMSETFDKGAVAVHFRLTWGRALRTWSILLLFLAVVPIGLAGCEILQEGTINDDSRSGGTSQSSTVQGRTAPLTLTEYVRLCVTYRTKPSGDYDTSFEAVGALRDMAQRFETIPPPPEVAQVHHARLKLVNKQIEALSQNPPDSSPTFGAFLEYTNPELASVWQDYNESQYTLSAETRNLLLTEGCIGTEDQIRKAQPTLTPDENRSIEEYGEWCSYDEINGDGDYTTFGEVTAAFQRELARFEAVMPPAELASFHQARIGLFRVVIDIFGKSPPDTILDEAVRVDFDLEYNNRGHEVLVFDPPMFWVRPELKHHWDALVSAYQSLRLDTQTILRRLHFRAVLGGFAGGMCGVYRSH